MLHQFINKLDHAGFTIGETPFIVQGPVGQLEAMLTRPLEIKQPTIAVICHPHSLQGGTMHNKVVTTLVRACRDIGVCAVRFNFRGVGKSEGQYSAGIGETDDVLAVFSALQSYFPAINNWWLAGFSFGAYVSFSAATHWPINRLISIAPPVNHFLFQQQPLPDCPWLIIQGDEDEIVPAHEVTEWISALSRPVDYSLLRGIGHFFHGHLLELKAMVEDYLQHASQGKA